MTTGSTNATLPMTIQGESRSAHYEAYGLLENHIREVRVKNNFPSIIISLAMAMLLAPISLVGCGGEVSFTTASLSEATMTTGVDADFRPLNVTNAFTPDTPVIYCSVKVSNAPPDTEIRADWIYIKGEAEDLTDYLIDSVILTAEGTQYIKESLISPDEGWPRGDYKVVLYVDGKEELTVPFSVR